MSVVRVFVQGQDSGQLQGTHHLGGLKLLLLLLLNGLLRHETSLSHNWGGAQITVADAKAHY